MDDHEFTWRRSRFELVRVFSDTEPPVWISPDDGMVRCVRCEEHFGFEGEAGARAVGAWLIRHNLECAEEDFDG